MFKRDFRKAGAVAPAKYLTVFKVSATGGRVARGVGAVASQPPHAWRRESQPPHMRHRAAAHATRALARPKHSPPPAALRPLHARPPSPSVQRGDIVEVVANSAYQKGMPHKWYHGRTGIIYNVTKRAVGVEVNKQVRALQGCGGRGHWLLGVLRSNGCMMGGPLTSCCRLSAL